MGIPYYEYFIENFKCKNCNSIIDKLKVKTEIYSSNYSIPLKRNKVYCPICNKPNFVQRKYCNSITLTTNTYGLDDDYTLTEEEFNNKVINYLKQQIELKIKNTKEASLDRITEKQKKKRLKEFENELKELETNTQNIINNYIIES